MFSCVCFWLSSVLNFRIWHCQKQSGHVSMPQSFSWIVKKMKYHLFSSFNTDFSTSVVFMCCFVKTITKLMQCLLISIFSLPSLSTAFLHGRIFSHNICNMHKWMIFNNCWQYYQSVFVNGSWSQNCPLRDDQSATELNNIHVSCNTLMSKWSSSHSL